jgi:hypothetical protein
MWYCLPACLTSLLHVCRVRRRVAGAAPASEEETRALAAAWQGGAPGSVRRSGRRKTLPAGIRLA